MVNFREYQKTWQQKPGGGININAKKSGERSQFRGKIGLVIQFVSITFLLGNMVSNFIIIIADLTLILHIFLPLTYVNFLLQ